tara:strand:+ start:55 stop:732 length:678 start_codon:yes stop_codon:yes gene_type:complete
MPKWLQDLGTSAGNFISGVGSNALDWVWNEDTGVNYENLVPLLGMIAASRADDSETIGDFMGLSPPSPTGYTGGIPDYTYSRELVPNAFSEYERDNAGVRTLDVNEEYVPRRPGGKGRRYFQDTSFEETEEMAGGGLASLNPQGYYLGGPTDGMADQVPAMIGNAQPAALSDGEFVIPADVVSHLGNGNSDAGAEELFAMMERVRQARTGNPKQGKEINPNKYLA